MQVTKTLNTSDLLPTVLNLMGIESPYSYIGQDAFDDRYQGYALFTNGRVTQMELPDGLYCYELRSGENMAFATVEPHVRSDFAGSLLFKAPLDFGGAQYIAFNEETVPNFLDYDMTPKEFMSTDFSEDEGENVGMGGMEL